MTDTDAEGWEHRVFLSEELGCGYAVLANAVMTDQGKVAQLRFEVHAWCAQDDGSTLWGPNMLATDPKCSEPEMQGSLKFDGCMNFDGDDCMLHACGQSDLADMFAALNAVYELGRLYGFDA